MAERLEAARVVQSPKIVEEGRTNPAQLVEEVAAEA